MDLDRKKIGALIGALRREKGLTQRELAEQLHVSDRAVSKWERGAGLPDPSLMIQLSDLLGITVNELLTGARRADRADWSDGRREVQDAVALFYRYVRRRARQLRGRIIAGACAAALLAGGAALALTKAGEGRILFPPDIRCEVLQREEPVELLLELDRRLNGVYDYLCGYELDGSGQVTLRDRSLWSSYTEAVPEAVYQDLRKLDPGTVAVIDRTEAGYLVSCYRDDGSWAVIETDRAQQEKFRYEWKGAEGEEFCTAFLSQGELYLLSRQGDERFLTAVDREDGEERRYRFNGQSLAGETGAESRIGGFLFDGRQMWVRDGVLCFAQTYYGEGKTRAVWAAYDLEEGRARSFHALEGAEVMAVRQEPETGRVLVLVNPMGYAPLEFYTLDGGTLEVLEKVELALPSEYLTRRDSLYQAEYYYLFEADMDGRQVAVLFGDAAGRESGEDGRASEILVVYDRSDGRMVWRGRLSYPGEYEIQGLSLLPRDGA